MASVTPALHSSCSHPLVPKCKRLLLLLALKSKIHFDTPYEKLEVFRFVFKKTKSMVWDIHNSSISAFYLYTVVEFTLTSSYRHGIE